MHPLEQNPLMTSQYEAMALRGWWFAFPPVPYLRLWIEPRISASQYNAQHHCCNSLWAYEDNIASVFSVIMCFLIVFYYICLVHRKYDDISAFWICLNVTAKHHKFMYCNREWCDCRQGSYTTLLHPKLTAGRTCTIIKSLDTCCYNELKTMSLLCENMLMVSMSVRKLTRDNVITHIN